MNNTYNEASLLYFISGYSEIMSLYDPTHNQDHLNDPIYNQSNHRRGGESLSAAGFDSWSLQSGFLQTAIRNLLDCNH